jgi:hypothetical protein
MDELRIRITISLLIIDVYSVLMFYKQIRLDGKMELGGTGFSSTNYLFRKYLEGSLLGNFGKKLNVVGFLLSLCWFLLVLLFNRQPAVSLGVVSIVLVAIGRIFELTERVK